jgi:general secretion pathway protein M
MLALPRWTSRAAALGILALLIALVYALALAPILASYDAAERDLARARGDLARYEDLARSRPALMRQIDELRTRERANSAYLQAATDALAAAELQERVSAAITGSGGTLTSTQPLKVAEEGGFRRVAVNVQFSGTIAAVHAALHALEVAKPFVLIDNLDLRGRTVRRPGGAEEVDPVLLVRLDLMGYLRPERE